MNCDFRGLVFDRKWQPLFSSPIQSVFKDCRFDEAEEVRRYYDALDGWALDVSEARFRSVPSFRFGPPGRLVRRDPETQPLVTRTAAARALDLVGSELRVWRTVLADLVAGAWPDEIVLMPALGGPKPRREEELRGLERLRQIGAFEADR